MNGSKPQAWIVDIDGTLALRGVFGRSPFDWHRVSEDIPNAPVVAAVRALIRDNHRIIYVTGRMEQCREATRVWLSNHQLGPAHLYMRPDDDYRPDEIIKREIYEKEIRDRYDITGVVDDRAKVVRMWRSLGLTVFQVAEGNF